MARSAASRNFVSPVIAASFRRKVALRLVSGVRFITGPGAWVSGSSQPGKKPSASWSVSRRSP